MNVPKLRFKSFDEEYKKYVLGDVFEYFNTNSLSRDLMNYETGQILNIHYGDIHTKYPIQLDIAKKQLPYINDDISMGRISENCYCKDGDIIIADASEDYADIGKSIEIANIDNKRVLAGLHTILARDKNGFTTKGYRGYLMSSTNVHHQIRILAVGSKVYGISKRNINNVQVSLPSLPEQHKIADFLSTFDEKIENQQQIIQGLEQQKKGFVQKIFSRELRFKDKNRQTFPDWQEKTLGEVATYKKGPFGSALTKSIFVPKGNDTFKIYEQKNAIRKNATLGEYHITKEKFEILKGFEIKKGDIIVSCAGTIGKMFEIPENYEKGIINQALMRIRLKEINKKIFLELFEREILIISSTKSNGSALKNIPPLEDIKKKLIVLPSLPEQQKIADFLSTYDEKIKNENQILEHLKTTKKGLLQQMFC